MIGRAWTLGTVAVAIIPSGFPTLDSTGVPAGTTLTPQTSRVTTTANQHFVNVDFQLGVDVRSEGCTFTNCRFSPNGFAAGVSVLGTLTTGPVFTRCTMNGDSIAKAIVWGTGSMIGCQVLKAPDGIELSPGDSEVSCHDVLIQDCYVLFTPADFEDGEHPDCIEGDGGHSRVTIDHCTVLNTQNNNSCLTSSTFWGNVSDLTVKNSYLAGGNFTIYYGHFSGDAAGNTFTNATFTNNHVGKGGSPGFGGYCSVGTVLGTKTISGNVDATTGVNIDDQLTNGG